MKTQTWLAQSCQLQLQKIIDDMMLLKGSLISTGAKQELIDILSNRIFEMENSKNDMKLVEASVRNTTESRTNVLSSPGSANRETQRRLTE